MNTEGKRGSALALSLLLLLLAACSAFEPEYAGVVVRYREAEPLGRDRLVVTLTSGRIVWYLEGSDMAVDGSGWLSSRELRIPHGGDAELLVALRGEGSDPAASGTVTLPLEVGRQARVDIFTASDPLGAACDGCDGIARFPIESRFRPSARDWLYVRWTGTVPMTAGAISARRPATHSGAGARGAVTVVPSKEQR